MTSGELARWTDSHLRARQGLSSRSTHMIQVNSKWFVAGLILQNGRVIRAAPILAYMIGWTSERVLRYARIRKWHAQTFDAHY